MEERQEQLAAVPIMGLSGHDTLPFALYLPTGKGKFVLYQPEDRPFAAVHEDRLCAEGVDQLYIHERDRSAYSRRVEAELDGILRDRNLGRGDRAKVLCGVAEAVCADLLTHTPRSEDLARARKLMASTASLATRDPASMRVLLTLTKASPDLIEHSLAVSMLALTLGQHYLANDAGVLQKLGLAGLLHDVGRAGQPDGVPDPLHVSRGYQLLRAEGLDQDICLAVLHHHERFDGSGFPDGLHGGQIPEMAQVVGVVDTFHQLYSADHNLFGALRALAEVYRGCFTPKLAATLVQVFKR